LTIESIRDTLCNFTEYLQPFNGAMDRAYCVTRTTEQLPSVSSEDQNLNAGEQSGVLAALPLQQAGVNTSLEMRGATGSIGTCAAAASISSSGRGSGSRSRQGSNLGVSSNLGSSSLGGSSLGSSNLGVSRNIGLEANLADDAAVGVQPSPVQRSNKCDTCLNKQLPCNVPENSTTGMCESCSVKGEGYQPCSFVLYRSGESRFPISMT
jgi:hypothetical protein